MKYDLVVAHRVCPALSKTAVLFNDKRQMVEVTTRSLCEALEGIRTRLHVILDGCSEYEVIFRNAFSHHPSVDLEVEHTASIGNQATYGRQLELLATADDAKYVYFSEDDYIYRKDAFSAMLDWAGNYGVDLITPIDHPDRYQGILEEQRPTNVMVSRFGHWREVGSSCLTFLVRAEVLRESRAAFESYIHSTEEATMWLALTKEGVFDFWRLLSVAFSHCVLRRKVPFGKLMALCTWKRQGLKVLFGPRRHLWSPIPTLAVHLSDQSLSLHAETFISDGQADQVRKIVENYLFSSCRDQWQG